jgi:hypothetical protein
MRLILACVLCISLFAQTRAPVYARQRWPQQQPVRLASPAALPPECTTRTHLDETPLDRAWVFIMNFRVAKTACMLIYDKTPENKYLGYLSLTDACEVQGDVQFGFGKALFRGGYITCYLNAMRAVQAITNTMPITQVAQIDGFYLLGRGVLSSTLRTPPLEHNLIFRYVPTDTNYSSLALRVSVTQTNPPQAQMNAFFNFNRHGSDNCIVPVNGSEQLWAYTRHNGNLKFWVGSTEICDAPKPRPRIQLWQDGAFIYIGGTPSGDRFFGVLDEIILDPPDGSQPPNEGESSGDAALVYLPIAQR